MTKTKTMRIDRRTILRGAGQIGLALPLLDVMQPRRAHAQAADRPRKFFYFHTAHGIYKDVWRPQGEKITTLTDYLSPFEKHKNELILLSGMRQAGGSSSHNNGITCLTALASGGGGPAREVDGLGISFDQILASKQTTKMKSVQLGSKAGGNSAGNRAISWAGKGQALIPQNNPYAFFQQLFSGVQTGGSAAPAPAGPDIEKIHARRGSVLDAVRENFALFERNVSSEDKRRLDAHLTGLRAIERELTSPGAAPGGMCATPDLAAAQQVDWNANDNVPTIIKVQMDLLAAAVSCDLTRVATFRLVGAWGLRDHGSFIPGCGGNWHHDIAHAGGVDKRHITISKWYYQHIAYFLDKLKAIPEGDKDALYNSVVMHSTEYGGNENHHGHADMCYVLAGSCGGKLATGINKIYPGTTTHAPIFTAIAHAFGMPQTIGDPKFGGTEPLPGLLVG
jgi:hypothetical protein